MAASNKKTARKSQVVRLDPTPRHLWLASLGALVAARRESSAAVQRAAKLVESAAADARYALRRAEADLRGGIDGMRSQVEPKMQKFSSEVEARLAPVVAKLGLKKPSKRNARKPAAKKPAVRRIVRKPAKRVAKQAAR